MAFDNVPACLRSLRQWVNWRSENRNGDKATKVPVTIAGYDASSTSPADWYSFESVCQHAHKFDGIGFVFTESDHFVGIDIDDCFESPGELKAWAVPIVEVLANTYAEVSPSGNGLKFFAIGPQLAKGRKVSVGDGKIEIYSSGRFFTVTGQVWNDCDCVELGRGDWSLINSYFPPEFESPKASTKPLISDDRSQRAARYLETMAPSISGSSGHDACFRAACKMVLGFDLSVDEAFSLMASVFNPKCQPPWSDKELRHKVKQADKQTGDRGYLLTNTEPAEHYPGVDLSGILVKKPEGLIEEGQLDEAFFEEMLPADGMIREIFDYYNKTAWKRSNVIGMAIAVSLCQVLFGRRIQSYSRMRTNDYNIIMASTSIGKETCKTTCNDIIQAAVAYSRTNYPSPVLVGRMQSGNGLMSAVAKRKSLLWICDEFGEMVKEILDKNGGNSHARMIAYHMLQLYGLSNSRYGGDVHSDGVRNEVEQPHFCVLGMTTGEIFDSLKAGDVHSGLIGRLVFWPQQMRVKRNREYENIPVPEKLAARVAGWMAFNPGFEGQFPDPVTFDFTSEARERWMGHQDEIDDRMENEPEVRAAIWARVAARSMKLALVHRASRFDSDPKSLTVTLAKVEMIDVEWGIKLANWFARLLCQLVSENVIDSRVNKLAGRILEQLRAKGELTASQITHLNRTFTGGDIKACLNQIESTGLLKSRKEATKGRSKMVYFL